MDWRYNTIWFDQLSADAYQTIDFSDRSQSKLRFDKHSYARALKFKAGAFGLEDFPADEHVRYLELESSNIQSFSGLSRFKNLKRLEVHYCLKLASDYGLSQVQDSLEWLHINQSKKFTISDELLSLHNLKVLRLNVCAPLPNLDFLSAFPKLVDFRFVDTNVLSGDLTPLFKHPTLCSVGFQNKRHYNVREQHAGNYFLENKNAAIERVFKGQYETFRYCALNNV